MYDMKHFIIGETIRGFQRAERGARRVIKLVPEIPSEVADFVKGIVDRLPGGRGKS